MLLNPDDIARLTDAEIIEDLYTYYVPGVEIPTDEELMAQVEG